MIRNLLTNISWLGAANLLVKPLWFLFLTVLCTRHLDIQGYGIMTATLGLSALAGLLSDLGTSRYSVREVSRDASLAGLLFSNFFLLRGLLSGFAFVVTLAAGLLLDYEGASFIALVFACVYTLLMNMTNYCRGYFKAAAELRREGVTLVAEKLLVVGFGTLALFATEQAEWTLAGMALGMAVTLVYTTAVVIRRYAPFDPHAFQLSFIKKHLRIALPLGLTGVFAVIYYRTDVVMIDAFLGEIPTGQYGLAFRFLDALNLIPVIVVFSALFPKLSNLWHNHQYRDFNRLFLGSFFSLSILSVGLAAILSHLAHFLVTLTAPNEAFLPAVPPLKILMWTFPFNCLHSLLSSTLLALEEQNYIAIATLGAVILNITMNAILIPAHGIEGAAWTTLFSALLLFIAFGVKCYLRLAEDTA